ncbi:MAG: PC4/YdbC family ssDNA-binding protein [Elusimicrobiota bacterium]
MAEDQKKEENPKKAEAKSAAAAQGFKPLKEFGTVALTDSSEVRFYVDEYKGYPYASIRTFIKRDTYTGPTKSGITLNVNLLEQMLQKLEKLPAQSDATEDAEICRLQKKAGLELVVRITIYRDTTGIDFREWVDDGVYKGWSKRGVRISYSELSNICKHLKEMLAFLKTKQKSS